MSSRFQPRLHHLLLLAMLGPMGCDPAPVQIVLTPSPFELREVLASYSVFVLEPTECVQFNADYTLPRQLVRHDLDPSQLRLETQFATPGGGEALGDIPARAYCVAALGRTEACVPTAFASGSFDVGETSEINLIVELIENPPIERERYPNCPAGLVCEGGGRCPDVAACADEAGACRNENDCQVLGRRYGSLSFEFQYGIQNVGACFSDPALEPAELEACISEVAPMVGAEEDPHLSDACAGCYVNAVAAVMALCNDECPRPFSLADIVCALDDDGVCLLPCTTLRDETCQPPLPECLPCWFGAGRFRLDRLGEARAAIDDEFANCSGRQFLPGRIAPPERRTE